MAVDANGVEIAEVVVTPVSTPEQVVVIAPEPVVIPEPTVEQPKPASTGNVFFDAVQDIMHEKGVAPDKYWTEVYDTGAVTPESRAELVVALGETQVRLIEQGITTEISKHKAAQAVEAQKVYDSVNLPGVSDGKAAFDAIAEWSKTHVSDADRREYNAMLAKGGVQAATAVKALKDRYMADENYSAVGVLTAGDGVPASTGLELIARSVYIKELRTAENTKNGPLIASLRARAKHTMANNPQAWRP